MAFWKGRRVLVTGATGIVGSALVHELLARGASVVCFVRDMDPSSELVRSGDLHRTAVVNGELESLRTLLRVVSETEPEAVFHLGAQAIVGTAERAPWQTLESNVRGTYNVLEACRVHADLVRRVVIASSDKAYGEGDALPYREEMPLRPKHVYEASKSCADLLAQAYHHSFGLPVAIARCGNTYGGGDLQWSRIVPGTIRSLHRNERPVIRSDGKFVRDYIYVGDVVEGYLAAGEAAPRKGVAGEAFNFSIESKVTVRRIVEMLCKIMGKPGLKPKVLNAARAEIRDQTLSAAKARRVLGWKPRWTLERGLRETVAWYERYFEGGS